MDFAGMKRWDLQALCKRRGLPAGGTNAALAARLADAAVLQATSGAGDEVVTKKGCLKRPAGGNDLREAKKVSFALEESRRRTRQSQVFCSPAIVAKTRGRSKATETRPAGSSVEEAIGRGRGQRSRAGAAAAGSAVEDSVAAEAGVGAPVTRSRRNSVCMGDVEAVEAGAGAPVRRSRRNSVCLGDIGAAEAVAGAPVRRSRRNLVCLGDIEAAEAGEGAPVRFSRRNSVSLGDVEPVLAGEPVDVDRKRKRKSLGKEEETAVSAQVGVPCRVTRRSSLSGAALLSPLPVEKKQGRRKATDAKNDLVAEAQDLAVARSSAAVVSKRSERKGDDEPVVQNAKVEAPGRITRSRAVAVTVTEPIVLENKRRRTTENEQQEAELPTGSEVPKNDAAVTRTRVLRNRVVQVNNSVVEGTHVGQELENKREPSRPATRQIQQFASSMDEERQEHVPAPSNCPRLRRSKRNGLQPTIADSETNESNNLPMEASGAKGENMEMQPTAKEPVRRLTRRSLTSTMVEKEDTNLVAGKGPEPGAHVTRAKRKSVVPVKNIQDVSEEFQNAKGDDVVKQPAVKEPARRSTRKSIVSAMLEGENKDLIAEKGPEHDTRVTRSKRKSVVPIENIQDVYEDFQNAKGDDAVKQPAVKECTRRSTRKSVVSATLEEEDNNLIAEKSPEPHVRRSKRKSVVPVKDCKGDGNEARNAKDKDAVKQPAVTESLRRSTRKSVISAMLEEKDRNMIAEKSTEAHFRTLKRKSAVPAKDSKVGNREAQNAKGEDAAKQVAVKKPLRRSTCKSVASDDSAFDISGTVLNQLLHDPGTNKDVHLGSNLADTIRNPSFDSTMSEQECYDIGTDDGLLSETRTEGLFQSSSITEVLEHNGIVSKDKTLRDGGEVNISDKSIQIVNASSDDVGLETSNTSFSRSTTVVLIVDEAPVVESTSLNSETKQSDAEVTLTPTVLSRDGIMETVTAPHFDGQKDKYSQAVSTDEEHKESCPGNDIDTVVEVDYGSKSTACATPSGVECENVQPLGYDAHKMLDVGQDGAQEDDSPCGISGTVLNCSLHDPGTNKDVHLGSNLAGTIGNSSFDSTMSEKECYDIGTGDGLLSETRTGGLFQSSSITEVLQHNGIVSKDKTLRDEGEVNIGDKSIQTVNASSDDVGLETSNASFSRSTTAVLIVDEAPVVESTSLNSETKESDAEVGPTVLSCCDGITETVPAPQFDGQKEKESQAVSTDEEHKESCPKNDNDTVMEVDYGSKPTACATPSGVECENVQPLGYDAHKMLDVGQGVAQEEFIALEQSNDERVDVKFDLKIKSSCEAVGLYVESNCMLAEKNTQLVAESCDDEQAVIEAQQGATPERTPEKLALCSEAAECKHECMLPKEAGLHAISNKRCPSRSEESPLGLQSLPQEIVDDSIEYCALASATSHTEETTVSQPISLRDTHLLSEVNDCMYISPQNKGTKGLSEFSHEELLSSRLSVFSVDANHSKEVINSMELTCKSEGKRSIFHSENLDASVDVSDVNVSDDFACGIGGTVLNRSLHAPGTDKDGRLGSNLAAIGNPSFDSTMSEQECYDIGTDDGLLSETRTDGLFQSSSITEVLEHNGIVSKDKTLRDGGEVNIGDKSIQIVNASSDAAGLETSNTSFSRSTTAIHSVDEAPVVESTSLNAETKQSDAEVGPTVLFCCDGITETVTAPQFDGQKDKDSQALSTDGQHSIDNSVCGISGTALNRSLHASGTNKDVRLGSNLAATIGNPSFDSTMSEQECYDIGTNDGLFSETRTDGLFQSSSITEVLEHNGIVSKDKTLRDGGEVNIGDKSIQIVNASSDSAGLETSSTSFNRSTTAILTVDEAPVVESTSLNSETRQSDAEVGPTVLFCCDGITETVTAPQFDGQKDKDSQDVSTDNSACGISGTVLNRSLHAPGTNKDICLGSNLAATIGNPSFNSTMSECQGDLFEEAVHKHKSFVGTCPPSPKELVLELQSMPSKENIEDSLMLESAKVVKPSPSYSMDTVVFEKFLFGDKSDSKLNTMNYHVATCSPDPKELIMELQSSSNEKIEDLDPSDNLAFPNTVRKGGESTICHVENLAETVVSSDADVYLGPSQDFSRDEGRQDCMSISLHDDEGLCQSGGWMHIDEFNSELPSCDAEVLRQDHVEECHKVNEVTTTVFEKYMSEAVPFDKNIENMPAVKVNHPVEANSNGSAVKDS